MRGLKQRSIYHDLLGVLPILPKKEIKRVLQAVDLFPQVGVLYSQVEDLFPQVDVLYPQVETLNSQAGVLLKKVVDLLKQEGDYCPQARTLKRQ